MTGKPNSKSTAGQENRALETAGIILLVEDEEIVRSLARKLLEVTGYSVLEAATIDAARQTWKRHSQEIDLILADVLLPDGNTVELIRELQREKPGLRVIFTSGYSADVVFALKDELPGAAFVQKPFHPRELMKLIDAALRKEK